MIINPLTTPNLKKDINKCKEVTHGLYRHFKGDLYQVLNIAEESDSGERMVVYKKIGEKKLYVKPESQWFDIKYSNSGKFTYRFKKEDE